MRTAMLTLLVLLLAATPASAARLQRNTNIIDFTVVPNDVVNLKVTGHEPNTAEQLTFERETNAANLTSGFGCSGSGQFVRCGVIPGTFLRFTTGDRDDVIDASRTSTPEDASVPQQFNTAGGVDRLSAGPLADLVNAGSGDDRIAGNDGADRLNGQAGRDTFVGLTAGDVVDGDADDDTLDLSNVGTGVTVSLNGLADDGAPGANANVRAVERVLGTPSADLLIGGPQPEELVGGDGDDTIDVRDGGPDVVDCGAGAGDVARVDESDGVTGCETVERPPAALGAAPLVDADRDGVLSGTDCDDTRAGVRPGARDVPGNRIDEDCSGADAAFALIPAQLSSEVVAFRNGTTEFKRLVARELPSGGTAQLVCDGPGCAFERRTVRADRKGEANLRKHVKRGLRAGAVLEIRLTAPEMIGKAVRFKMRGRARLPRRVSLCVDPVTRRTERCR